MNLMGKILTVLILLSSVVFLTLALIIGASHQNWQEMALANKAAAEETHKLTQTVRASTKEKEVDLRAHEIARTYQVANLNSQLVAAKNELKISEANLSKAGDTLAKQTTQITQDQNTINEQKKSIDELQDKNSSLIDQIAEIRVQVVALTNEKFALQGTKQDLEVRQKALNALNAKLVKVLKANGLTEASLTAHIAPKVEGQVSEVLTNGYFGVTIGNDDGLNPSHRLKVFRGDKYMGDATILKVRDNRLTARMIKELQQGPLKEGDYVTTER